MLSNQPCTNVKYISEPAVPQKQFIIFDRVILTENLWALGTIVGCAFYFKDKDGITERIVADGLFSNHGTISRYLIEEERIFTYNDEGSDCRYGFITDKGYFLDRIMAMLAYRTFCHETATNPPMLNASVLHSYHINWHSIEKWLDFKKIAKL